MALSDGIAFVEWLLSPAHFPKEFDQQIDRKIQADVVRAFDGSLGQTIKHEMVEYYFANNVPDDPLHMDLPDDATLDFVLLDSIHVKPAHPQNELFFEFHYYMNGHKPLIEHLRKQLPPHAHNALWDFKLGKHLTVYLVVNEPQPERLALKFVTAFRSQTPLTPEQLLRPVAFLKQLRWSTNLIAHASQPDSIAADIQLRGIRYFSQPDEGTFHHR